MINDNTQFIINKKPTIDIKTMEMCSCVKSVLNTEEIYNGRLYHTTDTNEFFFDWNDKRYSLNWINTSEIKEVNLSDVVRFGERISKLNNDANYIFKIERPEMGLIVLDDKEKSLKRLRKSYILTKKIIRFSSALVF